MYYNNSYLGNIYNALNYSLQKQASENYLEKYLEDILLEKQAEEILENYLQEQLLEKQAEEILENYLKEQLLEKQAEEILGNYLQEQLLEKQAEEILENYLQEQLLEKQADQLLLPAPSPVADQLLLPAPSPVAENVKQLMKKIEFYKNLKGKYKKFYNSLLEKYTGLKGELDDARGEIGRWRDSYKTFSKELERQKQLYNSLLTKHTGLKEEVDTLRQLKNQYKKFYNSLLTKHTGLKGEVDTLRQLNEAITKGLESGAFHANEGLLKTLGRWAKGSWRQGLGGKAKVLGAVGSTALSGFLPFLLDSRKREPQQIPMPQPSGLEGLLGGLNFPDPKTLLLALALAGGLGAGAYGLSRLFG